MTDRIRHLTVTLDDDVRVDDIEPIVSAIALVRGVASVERRVVKLEDHLARLTVRAEIRQRIHEAVEHVFRQRDLLGKGKES